MRTTENFSSGEYTILHFATAQNNTTTVSNKDTLQIQDGVQLTLEPSARELVQGDSVTFTVTDPDGLPVEDANITYNGRTSTTNSNGEATFTVEESGTATVTKDPEGGEAFVSDSVDLFVQTPEFEVTDVNFSAQSVTTDETLTVNATVQDTNNVGGEATLNLTRDGQIVDSATVQVGPEESVTESFSLTFDQAGDFEIAVNGIGETIQVTGVSDITYSDLSVTQDGSRGQIVNATATVTNNGTGEGTFNASFVRDNTVLAFQNGTLSAGQSTTVEFSRELTPGTYDITIDGLPPQTITVEEPEGIEYSNLVVEPNTAGLDDTITANATVSNPSNEQQTIDVSLFIDGQQNQSQEISLSSGESRDVSFEITELRTGTFEIGIGTLEPETVTVSAADLEAEITDTPTSVTEGVVPVSVSVSNLGNAEADGVPVIVEERPEDGSFSELENVTVNLSAGDSETITANLTRDEARNYTVRVRADPNDSVTEIDETNNNDTQNITGGPLVVGTVNDAGGSPAANDIVISYTVVNDTRTNYDATEIRDDGQFLVPVNATGPQYIAYAQTDAEEAETGDITFPRDDSPDLFALAALSGVSDVRSVGTTDLPTAGVLNVTVLDQTGVPVSDALVSINHRNNGSAIALNTNTTNNGRVVLGDGDRAGIELNGTTNVTVEPPADAERFANQTYRRNVTVTDTGEDVTIQLVEGPDLVTSLDVDRRQRFGDGVSANVTVENNGLEPVDNATIELRVRKTGTTRNVTLTDFTGELSTREDAANNSTTVTFDFTQFAEENLLGSLSDGNARVTAEVDPNDNIDETTESNNEVVNSTVVRYADPAVQLFTPDVAVTGRNTTVGVFVKNNGTTSIDDATVDLSYGDGNTTTVSLGTVNASETATTEANNTYSAGGEYTIKGNASDAVPFENNATRNVTVREFDLAVTDDNITVPSDVSNGTTFTAVAEFDSNFPTTVNAEIELPNGLELNASEEATKDVSATSDGGVVTYQLKANTSGASDDIENAEINISLSALTDTAEEDRSLNVTIPKTRITDSNSTRLTPDTTTRNATVEVRAARTFEHSLNVTVQGGSRGRTLQGLEYLFNYPYGCVEQTTSEMMSALRTDQYYQGNIPQGYDRDRANNTIEAGMEKLGTATSAPGSWVDLAQNDDGSWSMYGGRFYSSGDPYYTTVALQGVSEVANDDVQGSRSEVADDINSINSSATIEWLADEQDGNGAYTSNEGYFLEDPYSSTGFTMVAINSARPRLNASADQTANETVVDAAVYLVENQDNDGGWASDDVGSGFSDIQSRAQPTALALRGLATVNESDALRSEVNAELEDRDVDRNVSQAIDGGVAYLADTQNSDGSWEPYRDRYWWSSLGEETRTTGHVMLALHETKGFTVTGDRSNGTVTNASDYLVGVYDEDGSFGNTRASGVAIDALTEVDQRQASAETVTVTVAGATETVTIGSDSPIGTATFNRSQLSDFRDANTGEVKVESENGTSVTIGIDTVQVVDETEIEEEDN